MKTEDKTLKEIIKAYKMIGKKTYFSVEKIEPLRTTWRIESLTIGGIAYDKKNSIKLLLVNSFGDIVKMIDLKNYCGSKKKAATRIYDLLDQEYKEAVENALKQFTDKKKILESSLFKKFRSKRNDNHNSHLQK